MKRLPLTITLIAVLLVLGIVPVAAATGTVSGTVTLDGVPVPHVQVFLADGAGGIHVCTDSSGYYEVSGIETVYFSATGPTVPDGEQCSNSKFVDDDGDPLMVAFGEVGTAPKTIDFQLERLPKDQPGFFHQLKVALYNCYDQNGAATADILSDFGNRLDAAILSGHPQLSAETAEAYGSYAGDLNFIASGVCPQD